MADNFFDFLNKMDSQFEQNSKRQEPEIEENFDDDDDFNEEVVDNEEEVNDEDFNDNIEEEQEEEREEMNEENDIIEKSLDYAKSVLKVVRENFRGKDQRIMFETLRNTLNMYLNESSPAPSVQYIPQTTTQSSMPVQSTNEAVSPMLKGSTMTEEEWNRLDANNIDAADIYNQGKQIPVEQLSPKTSNINESKSRAYSKELPLAVRVNANGKPEVDLSKITSRDMDDMKVLMGLK